MPGLRIEEVGPGERDAALEVLALSFRDYPVMRFILRSGGEEYEAQLRSVVGFYCDTRLDRGFPVLALYEGKEAVAVTLVNPPDAGPWPPELQRKQQRLGREIGEGALARMVAFEAESDRCEPAYPHYFVGMVGVRPDRQGRGHARLLLDRVRELSRSHPFSQAVCLTTEDPANLPFYRRLGFRVLAEADVGTLHTWSLALPTAGS